MRVLIQFVVFKPLSYYYEETIGFDVKASFGMPPGVASNQTRILRKGYSVQRDFSWTENYKKTQGITKIQTSLKLSSLLNITNVKYHM